MFPRLLRLNHWSSGASRILPKRNIFIDLSHKRSKDCFSLHERTVSFRPYSLKPPVVEGPKPLFLWIESSSSISTNDSVCIVKEPIPLLLPVSSSFQAITSESNDFPLIESAADALERVSLHYKDDDQFVGGMGESDPGVWFASSTGTSVGDALCHSSLISDAIQLVKQERHGVPFGAYTTGLFDPSTIDIEFITQIKLKCLNVSLHASTPQDYATSTGGILSLEHAKKAFGYVCGFIAEAVERGIPVEVGIRQPYAEKSRALALSLGARNVHIFN